MKITGIERIKGVQLRISFDIGNTVDLDRDTAITYGLCEGKELTAAELEKIAAASSLARAKSRAMWYLSRGDCSERAMKQKLLRAGFAEEVCEQVVDTLVRLGLINDEAYAERLAHNLAQRNYSSRQILAKLYEKQIPAEIARQMVIDTPVDAVGAIKTLVVKKYAQKLNDKAKRQSVFAALARKGFSIEDIKTALREYEDDFYPED